MKLLVLGVVNRQAFQVERDPYSNAFKQNTFNKDVANPWSVRDQVKPSPSMIVWESKYELDSVAAFLKISYWYWKINGKDFSFYDGGKCKWIEAVQRVIKLVQEQQKGTLEDPDPEYRFERDTNNQTETLMMGGRTAPAKRCGKVP